MGDFVFPISMFANAGADMNKDVALGTEWQCKGLYIHTHQTIH